MKPQTAANKLGIYLPAAPVDFQHTPISRDEVDALRADPPEWLVELRRTGPFPRDVTAQKLGVSRRGLARAGIDDDEVADSVARLDVDDAGDQGAGRSDNRAAWFDDNRQASRAER